MKLTEGLKELEILMKLSFACLVETLDVTCSPWRNVYLVILFLFSEITNHEPNKLCTWNEPWPTCAKHANLFNYPSEKYKLLICSFLEYYSYKIIFVYIILCISKRCLVHDTNVRKVFPALNLTIIFIKFITCIITQPLICNMFFQWNIISPLNFFKKTRHALIAFKTWWISDWLTDWHSKHSWVHKWYSFPNVSISYNSVTSYFSYVYLYFQYWT